MPIEKTTAHIEQTISVLRYWHLVEFFVPYNFDEARAHYNSLYLNISSEHLQLEYGNQALPWLSSYALTKAGAIYGKTYRYYLYFLPFNKNELTRLSNLIFPIGNNPIKQAEFEERLEDEGETCFAKLPLDSSGHADFNALSVSTLPWAMGRLMSQDLKSLNINHYEKRKDKLKIALDEVANHINNVNSQLIVDQVEPGILTAQGTIAIMQVLKKWAGYEPEHPLALVIELQESKLNNLTKRLTIQAESDSLGTSVSEEEIEKDKNRKLEKQKVKHNGIEQEDENLAILNSFFLEDIEKTINHLANQEHDLLDAYVNGNTTQKRVDLHSEKHYHYIVEKLKPEYMNHGCWPEDPKNNMSLMQQVAINEIFYPTVQCPIFSVNGPPGTGKTTMLREIIAENIVRRARVLSGFETTKDTFSGKKKLAYKNTGDLSIGILDPSLTGYEMLIASSNNAAVENISKDLPLKRKLHMHYQNQCAYLTPVAAKVLAKHKNDRIEPLQLKDKPWGMISVALGNSKNRNSFLQRAFWGPEPRDQTNYRVQEGKYLTIWEWKRTYRGPSFKQAKEAFKEADRAVSNYLDKLCRLEKLHHRLHNSDYQQILKKQKAQQQALTNELLQVENKKCDIEKQLEIIHNKKSQLIRDIEQTKQFRPSIVVRIFKLGESKHYYQQLQQLKQDWSMLLTQQITLNKSLITLKNQQTTIHTQLDEFNKLMLAHEQDFNNCQHEYQQLMLTLGHISVPNKRACLDKKMQLSAFWQTENLNNLRSQLFIAALKLHEAWLAEVLNNRYFRDNIFAISNLLSGKRPLVKHDEQYIWQSFFMWVPVVSSTFASVARQFRNVGAKELGWLLIDEAGQAIPQAAVGALWRTKHAVVVGDPRQIEPVFGVPANLIEGLASYYFRLNYERWLPSKTSIQVLADHANVIGGEVILNERKHWLGCPLLVHRRCLEPMFTIANNIAYEKKMIQARNDLKQNRQPYPLGDSCWFDIVAETTDKQYVQAQGELLLKIFARLYQHMECLPPAYIISPFKRVKINLQKLLKDIEKWQHYLDIGMHLPAQPTLRHWCNQHIGTVHTFQGKESETVIFVLGGDRQHPGSVNWAASKPNLLNVALTRAKDRVYIIGDFELWSTKKYFCEAAAALTRMSVQDELLCL